MEDSVLTANSAANSTAGHEVGATIADPQAIVRAILGRATPVSSAAALLAAGAAAVFVALGGAPASDLGPGLSRLIPPAAVLLAGAVAGLAVLSPWEGLLAWIVVMPVLNMARAQVVMGSLQLILPSVLLPALVLGWLLSARGRARSEAGPGGGVATGAAGLASGSTDRLASRKPALLAWAVAAAISLLAIASSLVRGDVAGFTISLHGLIEPAVLGALVVSLRPTRRQVLALLLAVGVSVALASVYSVVRIGKIASSLAQAEAFRLGLARFTYFNVGIFGDMLAMALPLLAGAVLLRRGVRFRVAALVLLILAVAISMVAAYLTYSKSAWLGIGAGLFLVALLAIGGLRLRIAFVVVAAIVAALVVPYPAYVLRAVGVDPSAYTRLVGTIQGSRFTSWDPDTAGGEVSITERVLATEAAVRMAVDHPLLGVGPGGFQAEYAGPYHVSGTTRGLGHAHDMIPNLAAEYGFPMALLVVLILLAAFVSLVRAFRREAPFGRALAVMVAASLLGFVIVATTFGLDFYRPYRFMDSDVLVAGLLVAAAFVLAGPVPRSEPAVAGALAGAVPTGT